MTRKINRLEDYITASDSAGILSQKMGRPILPSYIHKLNNVRSVKLNNTSKLYHKADIEAVVIRQKKQKDSQNN